MPYRRTVRITTRWTPEEWAHVEDAAHERGVPPARYVREAALAAKLPPLARVRASVHKGARELVRQLKRVLSNLHQLLRVAHSQGAEPEAVALESTITAAETAVCAASVYRGRTDAIVAAVVEAGRFLNEVTHHAHTIEDLPPASELDAALRQIGAALEQAPR
jgi:hypothetical protein